MLSFRQCLIYRYRYLLFPSYSTGNHIMSIRISSIGFTEKARFGLAVGFTGKAPLRLAVGCTQISSRLHWKGSIRISSRLHSD